MELTITQTTKVEVTEDTLSYYVNTIRESIDTDKFLSWVENNVSNDHYDHISFLKRDTITGGDIPSIKEGLKLALTNFYDKQFKEVVEEYYEEMENHIYDDFRCDGYTRKEFLTALLNRIKEDIEEEE